MDFKVKDWGVDLNDMRMGEIGIVHFSDDTTIPKQAQEGDITLVIWDDNSNKVIITKLFSNKEEDDETYTRIGQTWATIPNGVTFDLIHESPHTTTVEYMRRVHEK